jgi:multiple sugar transport system substrate-binding protein
MQTKTGHDLIMFLRPRPTFENHVIDHREIYEECEIKYGKPIDLAIRSTYNPKTKKYFGFSPSIIPCPVTYRKDLWEAAGAFPDTWDDVRIGGRKIKQKHGTPVWLTLSDVNLSTMALRSIMYSFGAAIQDEEGKLILNSKQTLETVKFVKALYEETLSWKALHWRDLYLDFFDKMIVRGKISLALNSISAIRKAEINNQEISKKIQLAKTPKGPVRRMVQYYVPVYFIWKFAENIEGAKQFLVDYVSHSRRAFLAGKFRDFPCFPATVPDLHELIANDSRGHPPTKYKVLEGVLDWTANMGYPGYANAAIEEAGEFIPTMFKEAAIGDAKPEDAIKDAEKECKRIFSQWREAGLI